MHSSVTNAVAVNGAAVGEIIEVQQELPLTDHFGVAWHFVWKYCINSA